MFTKTSKRKSRMHALGQRLRELRDQAGLTVRELAARIGKTPGYVSRIETREEIPNPELLCQIAGTYGMAPDELLELAKKCQLDRTERDIEARNQSALSLFRKEKK